MTRHIVVGADGSDTARRAVSKAAELAVGLGARLHVVCAYERLEVATLNRGEQFRYASDEEAQALAENEAAQVRGVGVDVVAETAMGKPADALLKVADDLDADLIVVGNKRVQGMARLLGSIASSVASKAPCDVYVAHTH